MAGAGPNLAAVLGTGQTKYVAKRQDVSMNGLVREAIDRALEDSGSTFDDIDAVVVGKAPDFFEGVMMPELFMADAMGATGKPLIRVHTAGSVGGSTAIVAASLVQSGKYRRVLAENSDLVELAVSVADIITAVDEPIDATQCGGKENCMDDRRCMTHELWASLNAHIFTFLSSVSLEQLVRQQDKQDVTVLQDQRAGKKPETAAVM